MPESQSADKAFISKITSVIEDKMSNEQFGVSELAQEIGMSRSNLLRKIKKATNLSASQFIRRVRLQQAMELLKAGSANVSEVSFQVGFNSTSYFIKCFHEQYGFPPGEVGKREISEGEIIQPDQSNKTKKHRLIWSISILLIVAVAAYFAVNHFSDKKESQEKSIAVLPFKNDSNDSSNIHIVNGLMESILNNLQKIEDLRVISRTSSEKYRQTNKTIPEIAEELDVKYFVEGSGQKIGDQILVNIQLIDAREDKHIWAEQYKREAGDIFQLQNEVAKKIARQIKVVITPEEEKRIDKIHTDNLVAYEHFLKGLDILYSENYERFDEAIDLFHLAISEDQEYARAYAGIAMAYYFLDRVRAEKIYSDSINNYADQALFFDPQLAQSLLSKAMFYMNSNAYDMAIPYLEKALEYNPNSALVIGFLSDFYVSHVPNTEKYLEYALKGISLDINSYDSISASFVYLHVSNAFAQSGFVKEAEKHINKSLSYYQGNLYSAYVKAYILFAKDRNLLHLNERLIEALSQDTNRVDILQEVGKSFYYLGDYPNSYEYYNRFMKIREYLKMDIYSGEDAKIGLVLSKTGMEEEAEEMFTAFKNYADADESIYKHLSLSAYYSYLGDTKQAIEHLNLFAQSDNYHYWIILFVPIDPLFDNIKDLPEFRKIWNAIESKFWENHKQIKVALNEKELL